LFPVSVGAHFVSRQDRRHHGLQSVRNTHLRRKSEIEEDEFLNVSHAGEEGMARDRVGDCAAQHASVHCDEVKGTGCKERRVTVFPLCSQPPFCLLLLLKQLMSPYELDDGSRGRGFSALNFEKGLQKCGPGLTFVWGR
jgi:hypothetical protein